MPKYVWGKELSSVESCITTAKKLRLTLENVLMVHANNTAYNLVDSTHLSKEPLTLG